MRIAFHFIIFTFMAIQAFAGYADSKQLEDEQFDTSSQIIDPIDVHVTDAESETKFKDENDVQMQLVDEMEAAYLNTINYGKEEASDAESGFRLGHKTQHEQTGILEDELHMR